MQRSYRALSLFSLWRSPSALRRRPLPQRADLFATATRELHSRKPLRGTVFMHSDPLVPGVHEQLRHQLAARDCMLLVLESDPFIAAIIRAKMSPFFVAIYLHASLSPPYLRVPAYIRYARERQGLDSLLVYNQQTHREDEFLTGDFSIASLNELQHILTRSRGRSASPMK